MKFSCFRENVGVERDRPSPSICLAVKVKESLLSYVWLVDGLRAIMDGKQERYLDEF